MTASRPTKRERTFSAAVFVGIAIIANVVLVLGLGEQSAETPALATAWTSGVLLAVGIYLLVTRRPGHNDIVKPSTMRFLLAAAAIPFIASVFDATVADLIFAACAGGLVAVAGFTVSRIWRRPAERLANDPDQA